ncbi:OST-HTH/LOTUS domain-containing protein [Rubritalea squalenifaciens DSM 18772]|uniref:OST-HTH/LOTUS domain-containing protein n=2 Tax=Rubritalea squalenifaciens TaxID=407226 RepID=A0A1M6J2R8_9BACT|nr:OST-HTH/LOTUS domain-containing protein [Rubritalea squalenifaciens DSM 18772]
MYGVMSNATNPNNKHLCVLIDADNTPSSIIAPLLKEIAKYGTANVRRIYGDWTSNQLGKWKDTLLDHSIQPKQQFSYTTGKNATDIAMIIDAMDLMYTNRFDGFCLVSSDSDFTPLAARIREQAITVYGFGQKKTPKAFVEACDKFVYLELLDPQPQIAPTKSSLSSDKQLLSYLRTAIEATSDDSGWAHLGGIGSNISKQAPDFDSRSYGFTKLSDLVKNHSSLEVKSSGKNILVRIKPTKKKAAKKTAKKAAKK